MKYIILLFGILIVSCTKPLFQHPEPTDSIRYEYGATDSEFPVEVYISNINSECIILMNHRVVKLSTFYEVLGSQLYIEHGDEGFTIIDNRLWLE